MIQRVFRGTFRSAGRAARARRLLPAIVLSAVIWAVAARAQGPVGAENQPEEPASAQTPARVPEDFFLETDPDSALALTLAGLRGSPLSLDDALHRAMEGSTEIQEAANALLAAKGTVGREKGAFDPELFARGSFSGADAPSASVFAGADVLETEERRLAAGARIELPIGTELEASLNTSRVTTNSAYTSLNPEHDSFAQLTIRQPLLSGFGPSARADLSSAERAQEAAQARFNEAVLSVRAQVESAYWDVYGAERDLAVLLLIRDRAEAFLRETELRQNAGLAGPSQIATARVFLAGQELAVLDGQERLDRISDELASLLGIRPADDRTRFHPLDTPPRDFPSAPVEELITEALRSNHELIAANANLEQVRALARGAKWDALPALDLFGTLGGNGLSGLGQDVITPAGDTLHTDVYGGFGQTWAQIRDRKYPTWSVGLELTVPLGLREGRGERNRLKAEAWRAEQQYEALSRSLEEQVRNAYRELEHGTRRITAAQNGVDASQEQVRIGLIEYRNGRTTAFELVRLGADLAAAQQRYSEALVRTAKAAAELRHLTSGAYPEEETR